MCLKKIWVTLVISFLLLIALSTNAFASPDVFEVKVSTLNIRSGPGTSYSIIGTEPLGADMPEYTINYPNDCAPVSANGYAWKHFCYPLASAGQYKLSINGWAAWYHESNMDYRYCNYTGTNAKVISSLLYLYQYPTLTSPYPGSYSYGTYLGAYDPPSSYGMCYALNYPNAWRISRPNTPVGQNTLSYGNGWYLQAGPNF